MKYLGWVFSVIILGVAFFIYTQWNAASSDAQTQVDNVTASYNALVAQIEQRDAQWQTKLDTLNSTWAAQYAQAQATVDTTVTNEVNKAVAAVNAQWQTTLNQAVANASAQRDAQWQATVNTTVNNAIAARDNQWKAALAAANITANITIQ